jgi:cache domain-containing protein
MRRRELIIALGFAMAWPIAAKGQPDVRALRGQILLMQAEFIADKLAEFVKQNQNQVGWTTQLPSTGDYSIEQRRFDALRLLRQAPAVTELSLIDSEGKEFYKASRLAMDVVGSGTDYSKEAKFAETVAKKIYYGPVYLRRESEPYMTLGLAGRPNAGVSVVELNLSSIWDVVQQTKVRNRGIAYVVDAGGHVIAHPDFGVRKSLRDLSTLAQVQEARSTTALTGSAHITRDMNDQKVVAAYARVAGLGWLVFVELPIEEWTKY